jgi:hypothetical protein
VGQHLFVSYSRRDAAFVAELLNFLRRHGFDVWADDRVAAGERWDRVVRARIDDCAAFLVVMSPSADQSDWVAEEIDYARKRRRPIVPLLLDGEVFFGFSRTQHHSVVGGMLPGPDVIARLRTFVDADAMRPGPATGTQYSAREHEQFRRKVRQCNDVLRRMLPGLQPHLDARGVRTEVEIHLVDADGAPAMRNRDVVAQLADPAFGEELAQFNMEVELATARITHTFLADTQESMQARIDSARAVARGLDVELVTTGTLATVMPAHAVPEHLSTPIRYQLLNDLVLHERHCPVRLDIDGDEQLRIEFGSIVPEATGTGVKFFVETTASEFAGFWNASSAVAAMQVAVGANSPFLFGRQLWAESRIPLFEQVTDTRPPEIAAQGVRPRAWFGDRWLTTPMEQFEENSRYYPALLPICDDQDPDAALTAGELPSLAELRLHNGTIYRWNRAQYSVDLDAHQARLYLENRVLSAGPTVVDMVANLAFYIGMLSELNSGDDPVWTHIPFATATANFRSACRSGLSAQVVWPGRGTVGVAKLIAEHMVPIADAGLARLGVDPTDRIRYLAIIDGRCKTGRNGSTWQTQVVAQLEQHGESRLDALRQMVLRYAELARTGEPVHSWPLE